MAKQKELTRAEAAALERLGKTIAHLRAELIQADVARDAGIDVSTLSDLENGQRNPSYTTLLRLAAALRIPLEDLIRQANAKGSKARSNGNPETLETRIAAIEKALSQRVPAKPKRK
jgi:transcriptional regulator with XRE-family HTH domain